MFDDFERAFSPDVGPKAVQTNFRDLLPGWNEFFQLYNSSSFNSGVYRTIALEELDVWQELIAEIFPEFRHRIHPFGYDWLGRFFALETSKAKAGAPGVLLLSPFTNEALNIPADFLSFHNEILVSQREPALEYSLFNKFLTDKQIESIDHVVCAGLVVPLYLGGSFDIQNMQLMEVKLYWEITAQILRELERYPEGTRIDRVSLHVKTKQ